MKIKPRYLLTVLILTGLYVVTVMIGLSLALTVHNIITVGAPTALALVALFLYGPKVWPGVFFGALLANLLSNEPAGISLGIAIGSTIEAAFGAIILRRLVHFRPALTNVGSVVGLIVGAAIFSTMLGATIGTTSLIVGGALPWSAFWTSWLLWWVGDTAGVLMFAPFLFVWHDAWRQLDRKQWKEFAALLFSTLAIGVVFLFWQFKPQGNDLEYLIFPLIIWAAFRFKQLGVTAVSMIASVVTVSGVAGASGPFAGFGTSQQQFVTLLNMAILSMSGIFLAVAVLQREFYEQGLVRKAEELRLARDKILLELNEGTEHQLRLEDSNERITKILGQLLNDKPGHPFRHN